MSSPSRRIIWRGAPTRVLAALIVSALVACTGTDGTVVTAPSLTPPTSANNELGRSVPSGLHVYARGGGTCLLDPKGAASCWGWNREGRNGIGTMDDTFVPTPVVGGLTFVSIDAKDQTTCGLTPARKTYCWGAESLRLPGQTDFRLAPKLVTGNDVFTAMSSTDDVGCGVTSLHETKCWGLMWTDVYVPNTVAGAPDYVSLAGGDNTMCGLTASQKAYCWGLNVDGQVGNGTVSYSVAPPSAVAGGIAFKMLTGGFFHTCGLDRNGVAYCWGYNFFGGLGDGTTTSRSTPTLVATSMRFISISAGNSHTCAVTGEGKAFCWGNGYGGQLGFGPYVQTLKPTLQVAGGLRFKEIASGGSHSCGVTRDDLIYCWGANSYGEIGDGTTTPRYAPTLVLR